MNDTTTTHTTAPRPPVVLEDDSPAGIPRARGVARAFAGSLDPALDSEAAETLALVVSELATNGLRHGGGHYTLELSATADAVNVAVSDRNPAPPRERTPDLNGGTGGFGWHMIRRLADNVTITPGPGQAKTIHARLTR
ncbi:ATP-binding protein [Streptomyces natalensis]|uniref:ATP-binding protein n=1 Tax=Streptomyces natalensis ATCC 27448 TaxID=1240678 RepID=A0A0D7CUT9_9ACTN|nr:ATP-binding protein [Streptomyces natalensis]KIZ19615.1 ATP-binding protein [Streptomyces natalensis ATCC 27448]